MRKYFTLLYITFGVMSFAQFKDNVFDQDQVPSEQQASQSQPALSGQTKNDVTPVLSSEDEASQSSLTGVPGPGDHEEGPGNPGEPVPINDYLPFLFIGGLAIIYYYQKKNKVKI